jgi:hypothetical protein
MAKITKLILFLRFLFIYKYLHPVSGPDPDPDPKPRVIDADSAKSFGSMRIWIRIHNTGRYCSDILKLFPNSQSENIIFNLRFDIHEKNFDEIGFFC